VFAAASGLSGIAMPLGSLIGGALGIVAASSSVIAGCGIAVLCVGIFWIFDSTTRSLPSPDNVDEEWFAPYTNAAPEKSISMHTAP
jgi:hypothetical protein